MTESPAPATGPDDPVPRPMGEPLPHEGDDGLYTQSWYPICMAADLTAGKAVGAEFLGGRVVAFRDRSGRPSVVSAYCVHLGADLSVGTVSEGMLRCRFHGWAYDGEGVCRRTGSGDPVPSGARLFRFPTAERFGVVWAFNGTEPIFRIPDLPCPEEEIRARRGRFGHLAMEPWMVSAHTLDLQHLSLPHGFDLKVPPADTVRHGGHRHGYDLVGSLPDGTTYDVRIDIHGPNLFLQTGLLNGRWYFWMTSPSLPAPGRTDSFFVYGVRKGESESEEAAERALQQVFEAQMQFYSDDSDIFDTIHFQPGLLTSRDSTLALFLDYMRTYPRANPAREFLS
ncbi:aromatic ring-hydroxylating oxygenase subunit alpha [Nonomuraea indica]|uniref:Aromatic ring-hydroxylating dioxygenase subunit alpha n=1 Tax=Nonomuraea indica TaxID=1581193 RepID=A0ABW8AFT0_9ACTN|nr:Rieske 2Fe-2S domain-containing protein [Nonomuraea indica]